VRGDHSNVRARHENLSYGGALGRVRSRGRRSFALDDRRLGSFPSSRSVTDALSSFVPDRSLSDPVRRRQPEEVRRDDPQNEGEVPGRVGLRVDNARESEGIEHHDRDREPGDRRYSDADHEQSLIPTTEIADRDPRRAIDEG